MKNFKRVMAFIVSAAVSAGAVMSRPYNSYTAYARTVDEIQQEREANSQKIADLEEKLAVLQQNKADEQKYQEMLTQQIIAINDNIALLTDEIQQLSDNISSAQEKIVQLDSDIEAQQKAIDDKIETFKKRLCEMYVSSNDNFASVLVGNVSFYDIVSRVEMLNRAADYDQQLIDDILSEISGMEEMKDSLAQQKSELEESIRQQEESMAEKNAEMQMLGEKMESSNQQMAALTHEELLLSGSRDELAAENERLDKESQDAHERNALAAQRLYEEEMRKKGRTVTAVTTQTTTAVPLVPDTTAVPTEAPTVYTTVKETTARATTVRETTAKPTTVKQTTAKPVVTTYTTKAETTAPPTQPPTTQPPTTQPPTTAPVPVTTEAPTTAAPVVTEPVIDDQSDWTWPVPGFKRITSPFGYRAEFNEFHKGIDISDSGIYGQPVVAARSGIVDIAAGGCTHDYPKTNGVATCSCNGYFGNYVQISHDSSTYSRYGHMREIVVKAGQYVNKGDIIGYVGCTGWSTGTHLHFDVNVNGQWVNPTDYVK
ncbi:MAG: peptidoglycan DD-metalloendopeptidase family protein [Ruminococcus sp.]|nr:peptidoglycan DD-metalloendopeptidase family protein [Ruminococcus sp.]